MEVMNMELNFNKVTKSYLKIVFIDGRSFLVGTPNKNLLDKIMAMDSKLKTNNANDMSVDQVDELYKISGEMISVNKTNEKLTGKELGEIWDVEDLILFFNTYMTFLESITNLKN